VLTDSKVTPTRIFLVCVPCILVTAGLQATARRDERAVTGDRA